MKATQHGRHQKCVCVKKFRADNTNTTAIIKQLLVVLFVLACPAAGSAQEDVVAPPSPLQWPVRERGATPNRHIDVRAFRISVEDGANAVMCKRLMEAAGKPVPTPFTISDCPASFRAKVAARLGRVRWAPGAKPSECGTKCVGRPFMTSTISPNRPNTIFAMLFGHLDLDIDAKGPFSRTVHFGYEAAFQCLMKAGERRGVFTVTVDFDKPTAGDPGFLESITNFLLPIHLSDAITSGIQNGIGIATKSEEFSRCDSVGVDRSGSPAEDFVPYNAPPDRKINPLSQAVKQKSATVRFHTITRKTQFGFDPPVEAGSFHVFLNGIEGSIPDSAVRNLPASGGSAPMDFCKTIDMEGANRLQIIFVNSHGGAVWSQFRPRSRFGATRRHTMTTGRTIIVPGKVGPPDPLTGKSRIGKPQPLLVREFELGYTIEYDDARSDVVDTSTTDVGATVAPLGTPGVTSTGTAGGKPPQPCRKI